MQALARSGIREISVHDQRVALRKVRENETVLCRPPRRIDLPVVQVYGAQPFSGHLDKRGRTWLAAREGDARRRAEGLLAQSEVERDVVLGYVQEASPLRRLGLRQIARAAHALLKRGSTLSMNNSISAVSGKFANTSWNTSK